MYDVLHSLDFLSSMKVFHSALNDWPRALDLRR